MGMVVIQPYILVSKLKKIKTKFLRCTVYLNSIKTIKQDSFKNFFLIHSYSVFIIMFSLKNTFAANSSVASRGSKDLVW